MVIDCGGLRREEEPIVTSCGNRATEYGPGRRSHDVVRTRRRRRLRLLRRLRRPTPFATGASNTPTPVSGPGTAHPMNHQLTNPVLNIHSIIQFYSLFRAMAENLLRIL